MVANRSYIFALSFLVLAGWSVQPLSAQDTRDRALPDELLRQMDRSRGQMPQLPPGALSALEGAVDPAEYIVGPNDIFTVSVGGAAPFQVPVPVSADGRLVLPDAGSIAAGGRTLADVKSAAEQSLHRIFRNVSVDVALTQPRQFYVHVSGSVPRPGRFLATPVARVETIVGLALGEAAFERIDRVEHRNRPSLRNIQVRRQDGSQLSIDLRRYYSTGDVTYNPYLRDGDVIFIPLFRPDRDAVYLSGQIANPGTYELRSDDSLLDLLTIAVGPGAVQAVERVRITRQGADGTMRTIPVDVTPILAGHDNPVVLQPHDNIFVHDTSPMVGGIKVEGFVAYPGIYPVREGVTTLGQVIEMAGGLLPGALPRAAYLERGVPERVERREREREFDFDSLEDLNLQQLGDAVPKEVLQQLRLADLDVMGRYYLMRELQMQNRVAVSVEEIAEGRGADVPVFGGDRLVVPQDRKSIMVVGQVVRPGFVGYEPGLSATDYVARAGGTSMLASGLFVIEAGTGRWSPARDTQVASGDIVFVSRIAGYAESVELQQLAMLQDSQRRDARFRTIQTVLTGVATVTSVVTTFLILRRELN